MLFHAGTAVEQLMAPEQLKRRGRVKSKNQQRGARADGPRPDTGPKTRSERPAGLTSQAPARKREDAVPLKQERTQPASVFMPRRSGDRPKQQTPLILQTAG